MKGRSASQVRHKRINKTEITIAKENFETLLKIKYECKSFKIMKLVCSKKSKKNMTFL